MKLYEDMWGNQSGYKVVLVLGLSGMFTFYRMSYKFFNSTQIKSGMWFGKHEDQELYEGVL